MLILSASHCTSPSFPRDKLLFCSCCLSSPYKDLNMRTEVGDFLRENIALFFSLHLKAYTLAITFG